MLSEYIKAAPVILPVTLVTLVLEFVVLLQVPKSGNSSLAGSLFGFLVFGLGFGILAILAYQWIGNRWPDSAVQVYFWLAIGAAVLLTALAIVVRPMIKAPWLNVVLWTAMNFLWGGGYGYFLPLILGGSR